MAAHTALRVLAGGYLGLGPAGLVFARLDCPGCGGPHGRPVLAGEAGRLHFSLSHSGELALLAFARCWTRKEAYLKGTGQGLSGSGFADTVVGTGARPLPVPGWTLTDVRVPPGFAAACAARAAPHTVA
ncbi:4'-phosphopantetheinyl transferase superfamily protein [Streptomyces sp. NPDC094032]|uniref:4'-phosphopantetheinyl transferase family protein n=1 Tax=Streptomyces sp. NPDC094032 TaxID=3155308 RepID=UPI003320BDCF